MEKDQNKRYPLELKISLLRELYEDGISLHSLAQREGIFDIAGVSFNLNSPRQVGEILFDKQPIYENPKIKEEFAVMDDQNMLDRPPLFLMRKIYSLQKELAEAQERIQELESQLKQK